MGFISSPTTTPKFTLPHKTGTIIQLRTSRMKQMRALAITTGIYKIPTTAILWCSSTGLQDDEHDLTFHGGFDKAVHQYFPGHYPEWRSEFPEGSGFEEGGFGENIVCMPGEGQWKMNENTVCIGDIYQIGEEGRGAILQVSLPRQPCFKLNHRFRIKGFAPHTWKLSRTGWYYRVLKEGWMQVGDSMTLSQRPHPTWPIERIQEYLHRNKTDPEKLRELEKIEEFGDECKGAFPRMIANLTTKNKEPEAWRDFRCTQMNNESARIKSFVFQATETDGPINKNGPGFVSLKLPNGLRRSYSVVSSTSNTITLGVALAEPSRGGSKWLHQELKLGDVISMSKITGVAEINGQASNHVFIVGGIGVTAFLEHVNIYNQINFNYDFHYAVRSKDDIPFREKIEGMGERVTIYDSAKGERMDVERILRNRLWNSQVYVCGPDKLIEEVQSCQRELRMKQEEIHYEAFQADGTGDAFEAELKKSGKILEVDGQKTLLETMREAGYDIDSSCETGSCGTCRVEVCSGNVEHRGTSLTEDDKKDGGMLPCVSRGVGRLVIDW
ncbi:MOSC domain-containing protein [Calycina marina]|uniref:MOSC domain-containing protein n=1 Tax=Calycina marina TaxID=1763456 RepID=A0A9P7Z4H9_9HELO|nr:MOSC domain-containing protein [Calycina marina]